MLEGGWVFRLKDALLHQYILAFKCVCARTKGQVFVPSSRSVAVPVDQRASHCMLVAFRAAQSNSLKYA